MGLSEFALHELAVGGGTLAIAPMPGRSGEYRGDRGRLLRWGPALVITMTQQSELAQGGADRLGRDLAQAGVGWLHCPVPDFGVPDGNWSWSATSGAALGALADGGRVLVHCRGGCGRSGMLCLALMIAAGEGSEAALTRLRHVRPCAVETEDQMRWATSRTAP